MASNVQEGLEVERLKDDYQMKIQVQPPQSPDLNTLDLGLFHILQRQAVDLKEGASLEAIMDAVITTFEFYDPATLENVWRQERCADRNNGGGAFHEPPISDTRALDFGDPQNGLSDYFWSQERSH